MTHTTRTIGSKDCIDTGRVIIGRAYIQPQYLHHDRDALRMQSALLGNRAGIDWDGIAIVVAFLAALGAMGLALGIGLYLGGYFEFLIKELSK